MSDSIVFRQGLRVAFIAALQAAAPAIVAVGMLYIFAILSGVEFDAPFVALAAITATLSLLLLLPSRASSQLFSGRISLAVRLVVRWVVLLGLLLALGYATKSSAHFSRQVILLWSLLTPLAIVVVALILHEVQRRIALDVSNGRRAVFAGCNQVSLALAQRMGTQEAGHISCLGFFDDRGADRLGDIGGARLLGRLPDLADYVKRSNVDVIFVALPMRHIQRVLDLLDDLRDTTASIYYVPDIFVYDLIQARTDNIAGMPVIAMCETPFYGYRGAMKRLMDVFVAGTALIGLLPVLLVVGLLVKLSSPGPVLFRQRRYGLDGREITVYKFRSMKVMEDGPKIQQARRDDDRVTAIGKLLRRYSVDELPQLINVLQGRMSLVGPRPHAVAHNEEYRKLIKGYMVRHKVLPGITGLAQVSGCRGETTQLEEMQARVEFDLEYLRRWSLSLDLEILWRTVLLIFKSESKAY
jgi:putative colanic acid biosynthesis UDP-glucose lipid carrier transferase